MKQKYLKPVSLLEKFETVDVIATSIGTDITPPKDPNETDRIPINPMSEL